MIADIPIFIESIEVVERPRFERDEDFAAYLTRISEGRDMLIELEHPHDEKSKILSIHIGEKCCLPMCRVKGCEHEG